MGWTAILLAGSRPGGDALARAQGVAFKAQIPVAGLAMITRVAETLLACPAIDRIVVLTQEPGEVRDLLPTSWRLDVHPSRGTIAQTVSHFASNDLAPWPLFITTADHVLLGEGTVTGFLSEVGEGDDVAIAMVSRSVVRARFPANKRTWLRFGDGAYTGANLFALAGPRALDALAFWAEVEQDRKKGWRLVAKLGPRLFLRALMRRVTLQGALDEVGARLGVRVRAITLDDPLAAVDVDKASDLELATAVLEGRA